MPPAPIVLLPGLVSIRPQYSPDPDTGNHPQNILWFLQRAPVSLTLANLTAIGNAFDPLWAQIWLQYGATGQSYFGSVTTDFSSSTGLVYDSRGIHTPDSGANGESFPPNTSILLSLKTSERYRGGHARIYFPWVGKNTQSSTDPSLATTTVVANVLNKFLLVEPGMNAIAVGGGLTQRVYRHRTDPVKATLMPISIAANTTLYATQRRRLRKAPHH